MLQITVKSLEVIIHILTIRKKAGQTENHQSSSEIHQRIEVTDKLVP